MKKLTEIKSISALLKNEKAVKLIVAAGFALILIILLSDMFYKNDDKKELPALEFNGSAYTEQLELQLTSLLSHIEGVGRIKVMVTLESVGEVPMIRGAAVVCEGGGDVFVKQKVVETVSKVLGISTARVSVTY